MSGIDLDREINFQAASMRYFKKGEKHVTRFCENEVLIIMFSGILRFSENEEEYEVHPGEYFIQKKNCYQAGEVASDKPKYLYVHFDSEWSDAPDALAYKGSFDHGKLSELMEQMDAASHQGYLYCEQEYLFLKLLLSLRTSAQMNTLAQKLAAFAGNNLSNASFLSDMCQEFHYSKNYIERIFRKEFGVTPVQYVNDARIKKAMHLLESSSKPLDTIAKECGYEDYPYFYKRFVHKTGIPPSRWRKMIQKDPLNRR